MFTVRCILSPMKLLDYLKTMPIEERDIFAVNCGTSLGHLNNVAYGYRPCGEKLAVDIERESEANVTVEELCPSVDWKVIRGKPAVARAV